MSYKTAFLALSYPHKRLLAKIALCLSLACAFLAALNPFSDAVSTSATPPVRSGKSTETLRIENLNKPRLLANIPYIQPSGGGKASAQHLLDLYLPAATNTAATLRLKSPAAKPAGFNRAPIRPRKRTAILFIHGGGFSAGNKEQFAAYCNLFAKAGFVSATMNYSLTPQSAYPTPFNEVKAAIVWLSANADKYGFDAKRIVVVGYSAGGTLALLSGLDKASAHSDNPVAKAVAPGAKSSEELLPIEDLLPIETSRETSEEESPGGKPGQAASAAKASLPPSVAGVVSVAGISDLSAFVSETRLLQLKQDVSRYIADADARKISPLYQVRPKAPPVLLIHGEDDKVVPLEQSRQMIQVLDGARVPALLRTYPGVGHNILLPNPQLGQVLRELTEFFLYIERRHVPGEPSGVKKS